MMPPEKKLLDQVRDVLRLKHYAYRTEEAYTHWIKRFILFHHKRHPREMGMPEVRAFCIPLPLQNPPRRLKYKTLDKRPPYLECRANPPLAGPTRIGVFPKSEYHF